jgi:hypothetical protein
LLLGNVDTFSGAGVEDIDNCLGLGQVYPTIEKSPFGKFAWIGQQNSLSQNKLKDTVQHQKTAVTVNLDHILAGIGPGLLHVNGQYLIVNLPAVRIDDMAIIETMTAKGASAALRPEDLFQHRQSPISADPDDADTT